MQNPLFENPVVEKELQHARRARAAGKEGMARVCARRAANAAIAAYLKRRHLPDPGPSIYERLEAFQALAEIPPGLKTIGSHLLLRVSEEHILPGEIDLLAEVVELAHTLSTLEAG